MNSSKLDDFLNQPNNKLLDKLNPEQARAVCLEGNEHALIVAGAGSGKTRVLVHRIGWLIQQLKNPPASIVAVTFTNKAAGEMRHRSETLLNQSSPHMWTGTFHSLSLRFLRQHAQECGLNPNFQIIDSDDQIRLCRQIIRDMAIDEKHFFTKASSTL